MLPYLCCIGIVAKVCDLLAQVEEEGEPLLCQGSEEGLCLLLLLLTAHLLVLEGGQHLVSCSGQDIPKMYTDSTCSYFYFTQDKESC